MRPQICHAPLRPVAVRSRTTFPTRPLTLALAAAAFGCALPARAVEFSVGAVNATLDSKLSAGVAMRTEKRDDILVGIANGGTAFSTNGDDGNLAFDQFDLVNGVVKLTSDLTLRVGDNYGAFVRGSVGYSPVLDHEDFFDPDDYGAGREASQAIRDRKESDVEERVVRYADLLDAYAYTNQTVFGRTAALRVGKQVINWGESTLVQNGLNSILALDANRLRNPGFELEEIIQPSANVWASVGLPLGLNVEAFYQLRWERTEPDASGTFFSTNDFSGIGGNSANLGFGRADENVPAGTRCAAPPAGGSNCVPVGSFVPRTRDVTPGNDGQFGAALRGSLPVLNDLELAIYGAQYHSRLPLISGTSRAGGGLTPARTASYFREYPEDIQMYGLSFNTTLPLELALQGEYSYKRGQPLQVDDVEILLAGLGAVSQINTVAGGSLGGQYLRGWRRHDVSQADFSITRIFGPSAFMRSDQMVSLIEVAVMKVHDLPSQSVLRYEGPATYAPGNAAAAAAQGLPQQTAGYATPISWGYKVVTRFDYNNFLGLFNLQPTLRFDHDVRGISPTPLTNFVNDRKQITGSLGFTYRSNLSGEVGYTTYFGGGQQNLLRDRDFVEAAVKYAF